MAYVVRIHIAAGAAPSWEDYNQGMDNEAQLKAWVDDSLAALTNKSGGDLTTGAVVILDGANDDAFTTTDVIGDRRVLGVLWEAIDSNAAGKVICGRRRGTVLVQGNVTRGHWLRTSATAGRAEDAGTSKPLSGAVGYATTEYTGGASGSVSAIIDPENDLGLSTGKSYHGGGYAGGAAVSTTHKLDFATETSSAVAGAALGAARTDAAGNGPRTTHGYFLGGTPSTDANSAATAYKVTAATDITAAAAGANLSVARRRVGGISPVDGSWGYAWAGTSTGSATLATLDKTTYATDINTGLGNALTASYGAVGGSASATVGFGTGGQSTTTLVRRVQVVTDVATASSSVLSVARQDHGAASEGTKVIHAGDSATPKNTSERMVFATEVVTGLGATLASARGYCHAGVSPLNGYFVGGGSTGAPVTTVDAVSFSAETIAAVGGAALSVATTSLAPVSIQQ